MQKNTYIEQNFKKGTIHMVHWARTLVNSGDVLKAFRGRIVKETIGTFRIGVTYANMAVNKDKKTGGLPYGYFEYSNELIYSPSTNTYQLRLTTTGKASNRPTVKWYLDGKEITKEELIAMNALGSRQRNPQEPSLVINVKLDDIIEIK